MEWDFLTMHGRLANRVASSYADYRASGWPRDRTLDRIVNDLRDFSYDSLSEKDIRNDVANHAEVKRIIDTCSRQECPEKLLSKLLERSAIMYENRNARKKVAKKYFNDIHFPLFSEKIYELIEREREKRFSDLRKSKYYE